MNEFISEKEEIIKRAQESFEKIINAETLNELECEYNNYVAEIVSMRDRLGKLINKKNEIEKQTDSANMKGLMTNMIEKFVNADANKRLGEAERNMLNIAGFSDDDINLVLLEIEKTIIREDLIEDKPEEDIPVQANEKSEPEKEEIEVMCIDTENEPTIVCDNIADDIDKQDAVVVAQAEIVDENEPVYVVFYSLNNAAYIALDERMRCCVPVRNLAKAYCVSASVDGIANGQNELSKYRLEKLKPIQLKFLTQKEYDDSIGKALVMKALMENMPVMQSNNTIDSSHKVSNFASNTKSTASNHIGSKSTPDYNLPGSQYSGGNRYGEKKSGYDWLHNDAYSTTTPNSPSTQSSRKSFNVTTTQAIENPKMLYRMMHNDIDDDGGPCDALVESYMNDITDVQSSQAVTMGDIEDFDTLIRAINIAIYNIEKTKSAWLVYCFVAQQKVIDTDYMMDIDYALLDKAIEKWNGGHPDNKVMYVEDFDPTIISFKKKISAAAKKYVSEEKELISMAIYNYVRCLIAYETFTGGSAHF